MDFLADMMITWELYFQAQGLAPRIDVGKYTVLPTSHMSSWPRRTRPRNNDNHEGN